MTTLAAVNIDQRFSFEVLAPVLGNTFKDVVLDCKLNAATARALGFDIYAMHQNVYPAVLAAGVSIPNDPTQYNYIRVRFASGEVATIGEPWIRPGSISVSDGKTLVLTWQDIDDTTRQRILLACSQNNAKPDSQVWS